MGETSSERKINRLNDILFRFIFGREEHKKLLIDLITGCFEDYGFLPLFKIADLTYLDPEELPKGEERKLSRMDILVKTDTGTHINVEVQVVNKREYFSRAVFYMVNMVQRQLMRSEKYSELRPCISINLIDFDFNGLMMPEWGAKNLKATDTEHLRGFGVCEYKTGQVGTDLMSFFFISLPRWRKAEKRISSKELNRLGRWLSYLCSEDDNSSRLDELSAVSPLIKEAMMIEANFRMNDKQWRAYLNREMELRDYKNDIEGSREEGRAEGIAEGIAIVITQMFKQGCSAEQIAALTTQSLEFINKVIAGVKAEQTPTA